MTDIIKCFPPHLLPPPPTPPFPPPHPPPTPSQPLPPSSPSIIPSDKCTSMVDSDTRHQSRRCNPVHVTM